MLSDAVGLATSGGPLDNPLNDPLVPATADSADAPATCFARGCALGCFFFTIFSIFSASYLYFIDRMPRWIRWHRPLPVHHLIDFLRVRKVFCNLLSTHLQSAKRLETGVQRAVVNPLGMQLQVNPLINAHCHHLLHISGARAEGKSIQSVQCASLIARAGRVFIQVVFFCSKQLWHDTRQHQPKNARREKKDSEFRVTARHEDSGGWCS